VPPHALASYTVLNLSTSDVCNVTNLKSMTLLPITEFLAVTVRSLF